VPSCTAHVAMAADVPPLARPQDEALRPDGVVLVEVDAPSNVHSLHRGPGGHGSLPGEARRLLAAGMCCSPTGSILGQISYRSQRSESSAPKMHPDKLEGASSTQLTDLVSQCNEQACGDVSCITLEKDQVEALVRNVSFKESRIRRLRLGLAGTATLVFILAAVTLGINIISAELTKEAHVNSYNEMVGTNNEMVKTMQLESWSRLRATSFCSA